jgi:hypothetical protein
MVLAHWTGVEGIVAQANHIANLVEELSAARRGVHFASSVEGT